MREIANYRYIIGVDPGDIHNSGAICIMTRDKEIISCYSINYESNIEKFNKQIEELQLLYKEAYIIKEGDTLPKVSTRHELYKIKSLKSLLVRQLKENISTMDLSEFYDENLM